MPGSSNQISDRPKATLEYGVVQRLLASKVVVETGWGQAELARQVANSNPINAACREEALCDIEDNLTGRN
jgi:hypothetical protein